MSAWVLVTGGATRLGREIGLAFANAGWNLICHYRNSESEAQTLCEEVRALGVLARPLFAELESEQSCHELYHHAQEISHNALSCIVNNASLFVPDNAHDFEEEQALEQLRVNLIAPMRFGKWFYESTSKAPPGTHKSPASIIHILDQIVFNLYPDYFSYTSGPQNLENFKIASKANLMGTPTAPEEVAQSVLFLAQNSHITGTTIKVDNGQHLIPTARDIMFVTDQLIRSKP
jgi:NAD(P)-dependent dehydrogenase (short-subunit alcohol dehydrogenase family)